ncbi:hypothetical protein [Lutibacter sp. HS1-25]|uniref:hypothetical protein n=1 Tax=Lutibacter sp. HS1-25 TaxID=2485000 RepID=UPI0010118E06|nr:hypothetical protein [Lutibacter sp. HS1-25]
MKENQKGKNLIHSKHYTVISMEFISHINKPLSIFMRIVSEDGIPALYNKNIFKIINSKIGNDYVYKENSEESFELVPEIMSYKGFWDNFFDVEEKAINIFKERFPEYKNKLFYK